eukprot:3453361-Karenia_brevis.AAC.1
MCIRDSAYGEHKGKLFSEVAKKYPKYSRKFDGARKIPAYFKEYLEWLKTQVPESSFTKEKPRRKGMPVKKERPCPNGCTEFT